MSPTRHRMADVTRGQFCFPTVAATGPLPANRPAMSLDTPCQEVASTSPPA